jgi:hypothetical protein
LADVVDKVFFPRGQRISKAVSEKLRNLTGETAVFANFRPTTCLETSIGTTRRFCSVAWYDGSCDGFGDQHRAFFAVVFHFNFRDDAGAGADGDHTKC